MTIFNLPLLLTEKTSDLLSVLTGRVPMLTIPQIANEWFLDTRDPAMNAMQTAKRLEARGLVRVFPAMAHPPIELAAPLFRWTPPQTQEPDFGRLAYQAKSRWKWPLVRTQMVSATSQANALVGGRLGGRPIRSRDLTHDLHVAQLYLQIRNQSPTVADTWRPEAELFMERQGQGTKIPDAEVQTPDCLAIEFAGAYGKSKLVRIHQDFKKGAYELW
jgi:hypothetical protein